MANTSAPTDSENIRIDLSLVEAQHLMWILQDAYDDWGRELAQNLHTVLTERLRASGTLGPEEEL